MGLLILFFFFFFLIFSCISYNSTAFDPLDPTGNITIKWDVVAWSPDGYVAVVMINNFYKYRHIEAPGWSLQWTWAEKEVIWDMVGAQTTEQGDCSSFKGNIPHSCMKNPTVVDLLPETPYNQQIANCCKGGVISSSVSDPENSASSFQIGVGAAGTTNSTVKLPKNFTLKAPGPGYTCGPAQTVQPTKFVSSDGRRFTQAMMTWRVVCTYSQFLARKTPACCVSLSSYYNNTVAPCPTCSCACQNKNNTSGSCVDRKTGLGKNNSSTIAPIVQCSSHMCPSQVHWHVMVNEKKYWQVKITVTNLNYKINSTHWNLVIQHPNIDKLVVTVLSFNYKTFISPTDDTVLMMWGAKKKKNDVIIGAGGSFDGGKNHVQSEVLLRKTGLALEKGWAFPERVFFNGDYCIMPPLDAYPYLPNTDI
ncbi:protein COBRA-like isoform X2 [Impatiens glandulifera]|uniref:protein COBRA-like isoform X2 n=1 Tax=Impatiens glandulifera TaxID=253017 RepID=UPI001FB15F07|nr:protein COBRA-like isoform X2 [Impatiens glandulifera]